MRILIGALAVVLLAGCAKSITEMREAGPEATLYSSKPVDEVSKCIVFAWQDYTYYGQHTEVSMLPSRKGGTTVFTSQNQYMADIDPDHGRTKVIYYQLGSGSIGRTFLESIRPCL